MMLTKNQIKNISALRIKKYRDEYGLFVAEGEKLVNELLGTGLKAKELYALSDVSLLPTTSVIHVSIEEMKKISKLNTPSSVLGIFHIPTPPMEFSPKIQQLVVALDDIQDPGNMGTIIRLCVWFGISDLICSLGTADCYNPKVVQSSMGAIAKIRIHYLNLPEHITRMKSEGVEIYGTYIGGENIYDAKLSLSGVLVMGNEGNGISMEVGCMIDRKITIPSFMTGDYGAESLNVATATAITLSEFRRRTIKL